MYDLEMIGLGLILLAGCVCIFVLIPGPSGRGPSGWRSGAAVGMRRAALVFMAAWFVERLTSFLWLMRRPGFSMKGDGPDLLIQFVVPVGAALVIWWAFKPETRRR